MKALWGGRFGGEMAEAMVPLNRSLGTDLRLWPQDVQGSQAWAQALAKAGVITHDEGEALVSGLQQVGERLATGDFSEAPDEDVHSLVERLLHAEIGALAGKLHTGRSRNDQVATDFRLWGMAAAQKIDHGLGRVLEAFILQAEENLQVILPGHTHLQQAQPIRGAHWALSHFWPLARDRKRMREVRTSASSLPLGSGALAGCPFPVDREWLRESLGFRKTAENSLDAVQDRDWAVELVFSGALLGVHLSRLAEDLVLFSSSEFGYVKLPDGFCTGSSLMPQKRNPDSAELVRGKTGRLVGNLTALLTLLKGLPSGYNRDLQEDKEILFDTADTLVQVLPVVEGVVRQLVFQEGTIASRMDPTLLATDVADYLVRKGVPFRKSHEAVGKLVLAAEEEGLSLADLPLDTFQSIHPAFAADIEDAFSFEASVEARTAAGGTALSAVEDQLALAKQNLEPRDPSE